MYSQHLLFFTWGHFHPLLQSHMTLATSLITAITCIETFCKQNSSQHKWHGDEHGLFHFPGQWTFNRSTNAVTHFLLQTPIPQIHNRHGEDGLCHFPAQWAFNRRTSAVTHFLLQSSIPHRVRSDHLPQINILCDPAKHQRPE